MPYSRYEITRHQQSWLTEMQAESDFLQAAVKAGARWTVSYLYLPNSIAWNKVMAAVQTWIEVYAESSDPMERRHIPMLQTLEAHLATPSEAVWKERVW